MGEDATKRSSILIIVDDEQVRKLLKELLGTEYDCVTSAWGIEAVPKGSPEVGSRTIGRQDQPGGP